MLVCDDTVYLLWMFSLCCCYYYTSLYVVSSFGALDVESDEFGSNDCFFVAAGTPEDKLRLFIINLICGSPMSDVCLPTV